MSQPAARRLFVFTVLALLSAAPLARAQTWTGLGGDNKWSTLLNWDTAVPGSGNTANFVDAGNGNTNISLSGGSQPIGTINFDTASAAAYNLGVLNSGDTFNFDGGGAITMGLAVTNVETINAAIVTGGDLNINLSSAPTAPGLKLEGGIALNGNLNLGPLGTTSGPGASGAITVDRPITGSGLVNSTIRTGSLNLNAQSTYSGGTFFNATNGGEQPAIRLGVDSVGAPGGVVSGPLGTGTITTASGNPAVFQPVGGDRTIANDWIFTNAIFVGSVASAPLVDTTPHNLTLTGNVTLGSTGRVLTNNLPAGVALNFGSTTVTSNLTLNNQLSFQTQNTVSGTDGGVTIINDPIVNGSGTGAIVVQNNAIVVMNNANNTYTGVTRLQGTATQPAPKLIINGANSGGGIVTVGFNSTANGATLGGTGSVSPSLVAIARNSILSPGLRTLKVADDDTLQNIGTFGTGPLAMRGGTQFYYQFNSSGTPTADLLNVNGTLSLQCTSATSCPGGTAAQVGAGPDATGATLTAKDLAATSTALAIGTKLTLMSYAGAWDNTTFNGLANGASLTIGANTFNIKYDDTLPGLNGGLYSNFVTLTAAASVLAGDYNNDGKVDAGDYVVWRKTPGAFGGDPAGYNTWRANFGKPPGSGSSLGATGVPEPTGLVLAVLGLMVGSVVRYRNRASCGS